MCPGAAQFAHPVAGLEEARRLREVLDATPATAPVTVVGAGPTGMETATELAETGRDVTLVCGGALGPYLHPRARRSVAKHLARLGVTVLEAPTVTSVTSEAVWLSDGRELPSAVTIWTAGFSVPDLAARSGLRTDALGRLLTDETLTSVDDERIVAAGDSAAPSDLPFRMSCQAAVQLGPQAADTVLSRIAGKSPAPLAMAMAAMCLSLGRKVGIYQFAHRNDIAVRYFVGGRPGAKIKEYICKGILGQLAKEARKPGSHGYPAWLMDGKRQQLLRSPERVGS
jgi:NADH:ubiquinone reductase (H+-translocating)